MSLLAGHKTWGQDNKDDRQHECDPSQGQPSSKSLTAAHHQLLMEAEAQSQGSRLLMVKPHPGRADVHVRGLSVGAVVRWGKEENAEGRNEAAPARLSWRPCPRNCEHPFLGLYVCRKHSPAICTPLAPPWGGGWGTCLLLRTYLWLLVCDMSSELILLFQAVSWQEAAGVGLLCPLRKRKMLTSTVCASLQLCTYFFFFQLRLYFFF